MKIAQLSSIEADVVASNNGLKMYLNNLARGRAETPRSWLYEDMTPDQILRKWLAQLASVKHYAHGDLVYQFDTSQIKKWGPQGKIAPIEQLMDIVVAGFKKPVPGVAFHSPEWQQAKANVVKSLLIDTGIYHTLRPRGLDAVLDDMSARDTLESNSGWPDFTKRSLPSVVASAKEDATSGAWRSYPAIALFRNYNQKTRLVWMYPMSTNLVEGAFTQPLKEALTAHTDLHFIDPWRGYDAVKDTLTAAYESGGCISASDFTGTDEHFNKFSVLEVFDVIKHAFQPQYWNDLKESLMLMVSIPLVIGENKIIYGWHGVSSGSNWTNDVETYFDRILAEYIKIKFPKLYDALMAIGDDMAHFLRKYFKEFQTILEEIGLTVGQVIKAEKTTNERDWVKFLQRLTIRGVYSEYPSPSGRRVLRGQYSTVRALNSSVQPEKFHKPALWSKDMFAVRQFMILENTVDHYLFEDFVRFVVKGNPYLKTFAKKSAKYQDEAQAKAKLLPGLNPTYNQEKRDSKLSSFASIRIAAKM